METVIGGGLLVEKSSRGKICGATIGVAAQCTSAKASSLAHSTASAPHAALGTLGASPSSTSATLAVTSAIAPP